MKLLFLAAIILLLIPSTGNGVQLCQQYRQSQQGKKAPIVGIFVAVAFSGISLITLLFLDYLY